MSQYYVDHEIFDIELGYNTNGDYVYMVIESDPERYKGEFPFGIDEPLYSNLYYDYGTAIKDIGFYVKLAKEKFDIDIPKNILKQISNDVPQ